MTLDGQVLGTPTYMSPEQASGDRTLDGRSDIFSLGCVLYEMLAGEPPFRGPTPQTTLILRFMGPPRPLRPMVQVPKHVEAAIMRALAKDPAERFATAGEFAEALTGRETPKRAPEEVQTPAKKGCAAVFLLATGLAVHLLW